ncbi:MAG: glycosyltransferase family 4 protein [Polyangiaceae bacterium]|nr:glycosyltransferase family 4 protein [Polyangiaceae bacterium]
MTGPLTVVNVAYPFAPAGSDAVGGAEQVLSLVDEALVDAGNRSIVVACHGSVCAGRLVVPPGAGNGPDTGKPGAVHASIARTIERLLREERPHVVHMHGVDFHAYLPRRDDTPVVVTLHLPLSFYPPDALVPRRDRIFLHGVSTSQMHGAPAAMPRLPEVPNGVRLDRLRPTRARPRRYALALGRICPEKAFHDAIDAAVRARVPLLLAGRVFQYPAHEAYFREQVVPRLGPGCRYLGPVGLRRKRALLSAARCLVVSSVVDETSSLVAMEALACGTPVVARRRGALPDIVDHGVTGFVVDSVDAMSEAIRVVGSIDRHACRAAAEARFDARETASAYLSMYHAIALTDRADVPCPS